MKVAAGLLTDSEWNPITAQVIARAIEEAECRGREAMREEARLAALGRDPDRVVIDHPVAIGYRQGRKDAASDVRDLPLDPPEARDG